MREAGALGARLTGAGFGGFAIALVRSEDVPAIEKELTTRFYSPRRLRAEVHVFTFTPAAGARVESLGGA